MKYLELNEGRPMPALGLGTWPLTGRACRRAVEHALGLGYRHVDTAQMYGNEEEVGAALAACGLRRSDLWVTSKVWHESLGYDDVLTAAHQSLDRLKMDYLDLLLIHWPNPLVPLQESLAALTKLRDRGLVRHLGVSNFPPGLLRAALELAPLCCIQVEHHVYLAQPDIERLANQQGLVLAAYCPLARGRVADDPALAEIGRSHGKTATQVALRWLLQRPPIAVVPRSSSAAHLRENLEVFDFQLDDDEMRQVGRLARGERLIDPVWAPDWRL